MKNVSALFKKSCQSDDVQCQVKVKVYDRLQRSIRCILDGDDFFEESLSIESQATSSDSFNIGGVCSTKFSVALTSKGIATLQENDAFAKNMCWVVTQYNKIDDTDFETPQSIDDFSVDIDGFEIKDAACPLGVFYISSVMNNDYSCDIEGYDGMLAFEKPIPATQLSVLQKEKKTIKDWVNWAFADCVWGRYNFTYEVDANTVNQDTLFVVSDDTNIATYRDMLGYLSILAGGFCTFDATGVFKIKRYSYSPVEVGLSHKKLIDGKFDDRLSVVTRVVSSVAGFDYERVATDTGNKNHVELGIAENPFLRGLQPYDQTSLDQSVLSALGNIADSIISKEFYGCDATLANCPYLELGDCVSVSRLVVSPDGNETDIVETSIIATSLTYSFGGDVELVSSSTVGDSPSVSSGDRSSSPKNSVVGKDSRVDDLIKDLNRTRYITKTVKVPLTYKKGDDYYENTGTPIVDTGMTWSSEYRVPGNANPKMSVNISTKRIGVGDVTDAFHVSDASRSGAIFTTEPVDISSFITDAASNVSNINVFADFTGVKQKLMLARYSPAFSATVEGVVPWNRRASASISVKYATPFVHEGYIYDEIKTPVKYSVTCHGELYNKFEDSAENEHIEATSDKSGSGSMYNIVPNLYYRRNSHYNYTSFLYSDPETMLNRKLPTFDMSFTSVGEMQQALGDAFQMKYSAFSRSRDGSIGTVGDGEFVTSEHVYYPQSSTSKTFNGTGRDGVSIPVGAAHTSMAGFQFSDVPSSMIETWLLPHWYLFNLPEALTVTYTVKEEVPSDVSGVATSVNENTKGIAELRSEVAALNKLATLLGYQTQVNAEDIAALQKAVDALIPSEDISAEIAKLQSQIDEINKKLDGGGSSTELANRVSTLETDVSGLKTKTDSLQSSITTLTSNVTTLESSVNALQTDNTSIHSDITAINTRLDGIGTTEEMQTQINELKSDVSDINTRLDNIGSTEEMAQNITDLTTRLTTAEGSISTLQSDMTTAKSDISSLGTRISANEYSISNITVTLDAIRKTLADHEKRITALEQGGGGEGGSGGEGGGGGNELAISDVWFEDANGNRIPETFCRDNVWYWQTDSYEELYLGISVTGASTPTTNQFYVQYDGSSWETFGSSTTELKSPDSFYAPSVDTIRKYKASATLGSDTVWSSEMQLGGFTPMNTTLSESGEYPTKTFTMTAEYGAPSAGFGEYRYKFGYAESESAEPTILQDWGSNNSITVTAGSAEVGGLTEVYVFAYATDGARTTRKVGFTKTVAQTLQITDNWFQRSVDGERLPDLLYKDGVWYSPYYGDYKYLYIGATSNVEGASKSFYYKRYGDDDTFYYQVGSTVTGDISSDSVNASSDGYDRRYIYKTVVTDGTSTAETTMQLAGYPGLGGSLEQLSQSGNTYTFKATSDSGLPSVGISEYKYKFRWFDPESTNYYVLQDYSTKDTVSFTLGSDVVGGSKSGLLYLDIKDGYETREDARDVPLG